MSCLTGSKLTYFAFGGGISSMLMLVLIPRDFFMVGMGFVRGFGIYRRKERELVYRSEKFGGLVVMISKLSFMFIYIRFDLASTFLKCT